MAARDTKFTATLKFDVSKAAESDEEPRKDFVIRGTVREKGADKDRNWIEVGWYDIPPANDVVPIDAIEWILDRFRKRLKRWVNKPAIKAGAEIEVTGDYKTINVMQRAICASINDTNRLGSYLERRLPKTKRDRRTKKGRGE
jgi:hypothetical protein